MAADNFTDQLRSLGTDVRRNAYLECAVACLERAEVEIDAGHPFASKVCRELGESFQAKAKHGDFTGLDTALDELRKPVDEVRE